MEPPISEGLLGLTVTQVTAVVTSVGRGLERVRWLYGFAELRHMGLRGEFM